MHVSFDVKSNPLAGNLEADVTAQLVVRTTPFIVKLDKAHSILLIKNLLIKKYKTRIPNTATKLYIEN